MATRKTEVKTIASLERMRSSKYGNPRFRVFFTDGTQSTTAQDVSWAYEAENSEFRAGPVEVTFERGQVIYARTIKEA